VTPNADTGGRYRPRLLDLCCGAGGATRGYQRAGWYVIGVDIEPQPRYCGDEFHQADALTYLLAGVDAVHASPVCKRWSQVTRSSRHAGEHPDQIGPLRARLAASGLPYVIENVPKAPLLDPITLCGSMFDLDVRRHRCFETNWPLADHYWPCRHRIWSPRYPSNRSRRDSLASVIDVSGHQNHGQTVADWRRAMGIDWMTRDELAQAIPPAYTEWIGAQLLEAIAHAA
jgi:DNA (cytosine-5)-methyltransferase 1